MKITEYGITVVYLMILCRIAYADWKYQIIEPWTHIGILTLACMEMLFRVGVSVQERCLGAVVIAVPMLVLTVLLKGGFGGGDIKLMAVSGFLNGVKVITYAGMLGIILSGICKHDAGSRKDGTKGQFCSWSLSCYGNYWNEIMDFN